MHLIEYSFPFTIRHDIIIVKYCEFYLSNYNIAMQISTYYNPYSVVFFFPFARKYFDNIVYYSVGTEVI